MACLQFQSLIGYYPVHYYHDGEPRGMQAGSGTVAESRDKERETGSGVRF